MTLQAIETRYGGHRFRSRTEARWAVFFDALGIRWDYEKDGFDLGGEGQYLPDFWLPAFKCYAEVKGQDFTVREANLCRLLARKSGYPVIMLPGVPDDLKYLAEGPDGLLREHVFTADAELLVLAIEKARHARFEHGETPDQERVVPRIRRGERRPLTERGASAERELIRAILLNRPRIKDIAEKLNAEILRDPQYRAVYVAALSAGPESTIEEITASLDEETVRMVEDILSEGPNQIDPERTLGDSFATLQARDLDRRAAELDRLIPLADSGPDKDALIAEKEAIREELRTTGKNYFRKFRRPRR